MNPQHAANFIETIQLDFESEWKALRVRYEKTFEYFDFSAVLFRGTVVLFDGYFEMFEFN